MFLIVGLGNPGEEHAGTRHNVGFEVLDEIGRKLGVTFRITRSKALIAEYYGNEARIILAKPQTFVNQSGESIKIICDWFKLPPSNILVIHDDLDIPFGETKVKKGGSSGGHKGLDSIIEHLGSGSFQRLRIGIGRPPGKKDPAQYVLEPFTPEEHKELAVIVAEAADMAADIAEQEACPEQRRRK